MSDEVFLTSQVGYRAKLHELPFPRINPNTTRRSRVVFGLIRGNGNECNFAQMSHGIAKCRQVYLLLIPRINEQRENKGGGAQDSAILGMIRK